LSRNFTLDGAHDTTKFCWNGALAEAASCTEKTKKKQMPRNSTARGLDDVDELGFGIAIFF
jgi:hypothetical protein